MTKEVKIETDHDLLIRIDSRTESMDLRLQKLESISKPELCATHAEKLKTQSRMMWLVISVSVAAVLKSFFGTN